jgi:hypothetical protein
MKTDDRQWQYTQQSNRDHGTGGGGGFGSGNDDDDDDVAGSGGGDNDNNCGCGVQYGHHWMRKGRQQDNGTTHNNQIDYGREGERWWWQQR